MIRDSPIRDELRDSLRAIRTDWRFTLAAACLLAVTLGAASSMFAAVQAVLLRPFGFAEQDRLAVIWQRDLRRALPTIEVAYGEATDWRARSPAHSATSRSSARSTGR